jgi:hypothetical protein
LKVFLLGHSDAPYSALARKMNTSEGALKVAIHRLRKRYRDLFRQEIATSALAQRLQSAGLKVRMVDLPPRTRPQQLLRCRRFGSLFHSCLRNARWLSAFAGESERSV